MDKQRLQLEQIDRALNGIRVAPRPRSGWIHAVRVALGMTTRQLATRLRIAQSSVVSLEKSEASDTISLQTLRRAADALECDLHYVLVPRKPLAKRVEEQAEYVARRIVGDITHSMRLEEQGPSADFANKAVRNEKEKALQGSWRRLWDL